MNYGNLPYLPYLPNDLSYGRPLDMPLSGAGATCSQGGPCGPLGFNACAPGSQGGLPKAGPTASACPGSTSFGPIFCAFPPL